MQLYVRGLDGTTHVLRDLTVTTTVGDLKRRLHARTGVAPTDQRLAILGGRPLGRSDASRVFARLAPRGVSPDDDGDNDENAHHDSVGVSNGATLSLSARLRGGMNVQVSTVIMMLLLGSVALIGIGISILMRDNPREADLREYNAFYKEFEASALLRRMRQTRIRVFQHNVDLRREEYVYKFEGSDDGVTEKSPINIQWTGLVPAADTYRLQVSVDNVAQPNPWRLTTYSVVNPIAVPMVCSERLVDRDSNSCPDRWLEERCDAIAKTPLATFVKHAGAPTTCVPTGGVVCGDCRWQLFLEARAEYMVWDGPAGPGWGGISEWTENFTQGFEYPFTVRDQELDFTSPGEVNLTIRALATPWVKAQNMTDGTMNWGQTVAEQREEGLVMVATGVAALTLCSSALFGLRFMANKIKKKQQEQQEALQKAGAVGDAAAAPMLVHPGVAASPKAKGGHHGGDWGDPGAGGGTEMAAMGAAGAAAGAAAAGGYGAPGASPNNPLQRQYSGGGGGHRFSGSGAPGGGYGGSDADFATRQGPVGHHGATRLSGSGAPGGPPQAGGGGARLSRQMSGGGGFPGGRGGGGPPGRHGSDSSASGGFRGGFGGRGAAPRGGAA